MDGCNTTFLLGRPIFRGKPLVSGRVTPEHDAAAAMARPSSYLPTKNPQLPEGIPEASGGDSGGQAAGYVITFLLIYSGQITIIPKPELRGFWGDSLTKPPFKVTNRRFGRYNLLRYIPIDIQIPPYKVF